MEDYQRHKAQKKLQDQRIATLLGVLLDFNQPPENFTATLEGFFASDKERVSKEFRRVAQYDSGKVRINPYENIADHIGSVGGVAYAGLLSNAFAWTNKLTADYDALLIRVNKLFKAVNEFYEIALPRNGSPGADWSEIDSLAPKIPFLKERIIDECDFSADIMFYYEKYKYKMKDQSLVREHNGNHYYGDPYSTFYLPKDDCEMLYKFQERGLERFKKLIDTEKPIVKERIAAIRRLIPEWKHLVGYQANGHDDLLGYKP
ncbi:hypothetical protein [Pseudomonas sputi]|uniref:hypothetical protein n=1 Tax=Pseudomonas sputi TaxID=2892325 RepID=UPI001F35C463|nr:hypothetical protein [Pseudomonas sputi]